MPNEVKGIPISPLTGLLDLRSQPDLMPSASLRYRSNFQTECSGVLRRGMGWQKLLSKSGYNNSDLHDQLLQFTLTPSREPITMLMEGESSRKARFLYAATQSRILKLNQYSGNWQVVGSGYGGGVGTDCSGPRFAGCVLGDYAILTNGFDVPQQAVVDAGQSFSKFPILQPPSVVGVTSVVKTQNDLELIGIQTVKKIWVWRGCLFLADVVVDGARLSYRFYWSDVNSPFSFDPATIGSDAGFLDLEYGEQILNGRESGNSFLIYTNKRVWELFVNQSSSADAPIFGVRQLPGVNERNSQACLFYENTLVDVGSGHIYMGKDRIWFFNQWIGEPDPVQWLHSSSSHLYNRIDQSKCRAHVACWHGNELYISVQTIDSTNGCPDITLRINTLYKTVDIVDFGFTAFSQFRPQSVPNIRDWIIDQKICTPQAMVNAGYGWANEGLPNPVPNPSAPFTPTVIYTHSSLVVNGVTVEDYTQPNPASDSICALVAVTGYSNMSTVCDKCESDYILVAASSQDFCLKQIGDVNNPLFYRERCTNPSVLGNFGSLGYTSSVGSYALDGYTSRIVFAPLWGPNLMTTLSRILFNFIAAPTIAPGTITGRVGVSSQLADPNSNDSCIKWFTLSAKQLKCLTNVDSESKYKNAVPGNSLKWDFQYSGKFLYVELTIAGTGSDCKLSGVTGSYSSEAVNY